MAKPIARKLVQVEISNPALVYRIGDRVAYQDPFSESTAKLSPVTKMSLVPLFQDHPMVELGLEDGASVVVSAKNLKQLVFVVDPDPPAPILVPNTPEIVT